MWTCSNCEKKILTEKIDLTVTGPIGETIVCLCTTCVENVAVAKIVLKRIDGKVWHYEQYAALEMVKE